MATNVHSSLFCIVLCAAIAQPHSAAADKYIEANAVTLPNGLRVILHEDHRSPMVSLRLRYHAGLSHASALPAGVPLILSQLMYTFPEHTYPYPISYYYEHSGSPSYGKYLTEDFTDYYTTLPSKNLETALWLESDRMHFLFPMALRWNLEIVDFFKGLPLRLSESELYYAAEIKLWKALFPANHPYHRTVVDPEVVHADQISTATIERYYRSFYVPNNATLVLVGDFDSRQALALVEQFFGALPRTEVLPKQKPELRVLSEDIIIHHQEEIAQTPRISSVWFLPAATRRQVMLAKLLSFIFLRGTKGRLNERLLQSTAEVNAFSAYYQYAALATFSLNGLSLSTGGLAAALSCINDVVDAVSHEITAEELEIAKQLFRMEIFRSMSSLEEKTLLLHYFDEKCGRPDCVETLFVELGQVSAAEVSRFAQTYLHAAHRVIFYAQPEIAPEGRRAAP